MKKILMVAITLIASFSSFAQLKVQSNFGIVSDFTGKSSFNWMFMNSFGFEFDDKLGIEYGYAYSLNRDDKQLYNFIYGNSASWTAGHFNHLIGVYYKTKREEGTSVNVGGGISILKEYNTSKIRTKTTPYMKIGIDQNFSKNWGGQINAGFGDIFIFTVGVTKTL